MADATAAAANGESLREAAVETEIARLRRRIAGASLNVIRGNTKGGEV